MGEARAVIDRMRKEEATNKELGRRPVDGHVWIFVIRRDYSSLIATGQLFEQGLKGGCFSSRIRTILISVVSGDHVNRFNWLPCSPDSSFRSMRVSS